MITQLYFETATQIGYINPPPLKLKTLPNNVVAQEIRSWRGRESALKDVRSHIEIDPDKIFNTDMPATYVIAHELTHTLSHNIVGGGGATSDGYRQNHGSAFLAGWLVLLKRLGCSENEIVGAAYYHQSMYKLSNEHTELALNSALKTSDPHKAMCAATIYKPTPALEKVILTVTALAFTTYLLNSIFN